MRLFTAITLNEEMRRALTAMQDAMRRNRMRGNFTPAENLHLTLAFIGDYPNPDDILDIMETVPFEPFPLKLQGYGNFGNLWWAGLEESAHLKSYVRRLRRALADAGIPFDRKKFVPHITLARKATVPALPEIPVPEAGMTVRKVSLMRSDRGRHGMIYTETGCHRAATSDTDPAGSGRRSP